MDKEFLSYEMGIMNKMWKRYSYDPFIIMENKNVKSNGTVYSDRLYSWDYKKHNRLCMIHFGNIGQLWDERSRKTPEKVEKFLRDYFDDDTIVLGRVIEYCNKSTGFPVWRIDYYTG